MDTTHFIYPLIRQIMDIWVVSALWLFSYLDNAAMNMSIQIFEWTCFQFSWVYTKEQNRYVTWQFYF